MYFPDKPASAPTFVIKTLGCKVNQYESQAIREELERCGFIEEQDARRANFYIINSCTVTQKADKETRNLIHHFHSINPDGKILVAGCYAETDRDRSAILNIPGVAYLVRNSEKKAIGEILSSLRGAPTSSGLRSNLIGIASALPFFPQSGIPLRGTMSRPRNDGAGNPAMTGSMRIADFKDRNRAFVKVQDGCNHRCSYCKVSLVRGPSKTRDANEVAVEVRSLLEKGFKEIVLTGVCLGAWGKDLERKTSLADLVKTISQLDGRFRIRLSSIEPVYIKDEIIGVFRDYNKVCRHFHIPLQSGDDKILKLMRRPYGVKAFRQIIERIRKKAPDAAITTDVILGFPGEDEKSFLKTSKFIEGIRPSRIHVFSYSAREGTPAAKLKYAIDKKTVKDRVRVLVELGKRLSMDFANGSIGKRQNVVIEDKRDEKSGFLSGYTDSYIRVLLDGPDSLKNELIQAKITRVDDKLESVFASLDNDAII